MTTGKLRQSRGRVDVEHQERELRTERRRRRDESHGVDGQSLGVKRGWEIEAEGGKAREGGRAVRETEEYRRPCKQRTEAREGEVGKDGGGTGEDGGWGDAKESKLSSPCCRAFRRRRISSNLASLVRGDSSMVDEARR